MIALKRKRKHVVSTDCSLEGPKLIWNISILQFQICPLYHFLTFDEPATGLKRVSLFLNAFYFRQVNIFFCVAKGGFYQNGFNFLLTDFTFFSFVFIFHFTEFFVCLEQKTSDGLPIIFLCKRFLCQIHYSSF